MLASTLASLTLLPPLTTVRAPAKPPLPWAHAAAGIASALVAPQLARAETLANPYADAQAQNEALAAAKAAAGQSDLISDALGGAGNLVLLGVVGILVFFIGTNLLEFVQEAGRQTRSVGEALQDYGEEAPRPSGGSLFVDENPNSAKAIAKSNIRGKNTGAKVSIKDIKKGKLPEYNFLKSDTGFDFAPWMNIDQYKVAAAEEARLQRKMLEKKKAEAAKKPAARAPAKRQAPTAPSFENPFDSLFGKK